METLVGILCDCIGAIACGWIWTWRASVTMKRDQEQRQAEFLIAAVQRMAQLNKAGHATVHITSVESLTVSQPAA